MPSIDKPGGGLTLTFAAKNEDVRKILVEYKKQKVVLTDYICNAIRFYEENKEKSIHNNSLNIQELVRMEVEKAIKNITIPNSVPVEEIVEQNVDEYKSQIIEKRNYLEDDLDYVDIDED